jgi:hypothetical protein
MWKEKVFHKQPPVFVDFLFQKLTVARSFPGKNPIMAGLSPNKKEYSRFSTISLFLNI